MIKCLMKPSHLRSEHDCLNLIAYMKNVKFFAQRDVKDQDFQSIIDCLQHESFQPGEAIMQYGDYGDKFYIILKGSVKCLIPSPKIKNSRDLM